MGNWYLADTEGVLHKACFVPLTLKDTMLMKWTRGISWRTEIQSPDRRVFKLVDAASKQIQGAISMADAEDHVYVYFIESAPQNRTEERSFVNVATLLIAFAGQRSYQIGGEGFILLKPKTKLIEYYMQKFKAFSLPRDHVGISGVVTNQWIQVYYK